MTRIYFLGKTPLRAVPTLDPAPRRGDVICYLRHAQNLVPGAAARLTEDGIAVVRAEELIDAEASRDIDALGSVFLSTWFDDDGRDVSRLGNLSLGTSYAMELARQCNHRQLIRAGETLRRVLDAYPTTARVLTDLADGDGVHAVLPVRFPIRRVLAQVASAAGRRCDAVRPIDPIPPAWARGKQKRWGRIAKSLLSGLRPNWVRARRAIAAKRLRGSSAPTLYMFVGRAQDLIARRLAACGNIDVVTDRLGIAGTGALRFDHLVAFPEPGDIAGARRLLALLRRQGLTGAGRSYQYAGVDYGPILFDTVYRFLRTEIWAFLVVIAQSRRLQDLTGFSALFVNGGGNEPMGTLIAHNKDTDRKIYLMPHGMDMQRFAYFTAATDNPHVTYLAYGADHADYFRSWAGNDDAGPAVLTGNPLTVSMNSVRAKGPDAVHRKRLLILTFGHLEFWNAARIYACDRYYAEIFSLLPGLAAEGWTTTLRSHPMHPKDLEQRLARDLGVDHLISWTEHPTFEETLPHHDMVVGNLSTACYQSLYAGWPTVIYEPAFRNAGGIGDIETDPMFTGLLTARDLRRPVTNDPAALKRMILDSLDPESMVSTFPKRFAGELAPRFIGPDPERADAVIADFLERDILNLHQAAAVRTAQGAA